MNCKQWDLAVITRGKYEGREVFVIEATKPPHVHASGLTSWFVEIVGDPIPCVSPDGVKVPTRECHIPDEWLKPVESFAVDVLNVDADHISLNAA